MAHARFDVYVTHHHIDNVWADADLSAQSVRKSLIEHDGYPSTISVYKNAVGRARFTDCARASHPEELK